MPGAAAHSPFKRLNGRRFRVPGLPQDSPRYGHVAIARTVMFVTYGFRAGDYGFSQQRRPVTRPLISRGTTMTNDIEFTSLATGVLFAGVMLWAYIGHCMSFAVACL